MSGLSAKKAPIHIDRRRPEHPSLRAYPNIRAAARMLSVAPSTLSRRVDLRSERRGERDRVLPPSEVLRLATIYRKRSLNDVAQDLIEHARMSSADEGSRIEEEVEAFFEEQVGSEEAREEVLERARQLLPSELYEKVQASLTEPGEPLPESFSGYLPLPKT
jgi:hypothetical protein